MRRTVILFLALSGVFTGLSRADRTGAESACREGESLLERGDPAAAAAALERAIDQDPGWSRPWAYRGRSKMLRGNYTAALEDYSRAIALEPNPNYYLWRCQSFMAGDRWAEAAEDAESLLKISPDMPPALSLHGWALVNLGDVDGGLAEQDKALALGRSAAYYQRFDGYLRKADWAAVTQEARQALAAGATRPAIQFYLAVGLVEQGAYAEARDAIAAARARYGSLVEIQVAQAWLAGTPAAGPLFDPEESLRALASSESLLAFHINAQGRTLFLAGRTHECLELLSTRGRRTNFDTLFWLGAAQWKLGRLAEARATLADARRLNPYIARHADRIPDLGPFVAAIDREIGTEGQGGPDRKKLDHELATHLLTVAEIEVMVKRYQFARAAAEYARLIPTLRSAVRKAEVEARLPEVKGMAGAHARLVGAVQKGGLVLKTRVGKTDLTIVKADEVVFEFRLAQGEGKFPWAYLDPAVYCDFALQALPTPEEMFGLGCLAWDAGRPVESHRLFEDALKKKPALRAGLAAFVARRRGLPVPEGGFLYFRNTYVTQEEKKNLEKGLVSFEGKWVTAKDREFLAKGMVQVAGKWVPGDEAELLKRGYKKHEGKWMSRDDYEELRGQWANAFVEETAHYTVKTNQSESFAKDLAALMEVAYERYREYYGGAEPKLPAKEKMVLFAFRTYEDYRQHCVETKSEGHLNAAGFARSDSNVVVGWNKTGNEQQFLQTMVHEGAHLYFFRVSPGVAPASWYAEAMATYFEGFAWDGKTYKFNYLSESRLPFVRDAMKGGRQIPLADLMSGDALTLINKDHNKALLFYAECWSLNYYLCQTDNRAYRAAYTEYRKSVSAGKSEPLAKYFPDPVQLEKDWIQFISGM